MHPSLGAKLLGLSGLLVAFGVVIGSVSIVNLADASARAQSPCRR